MSSESLANSYNRVGCLCLLNAWQLFIDFYGRLGPLPHHIP